MMPLADLRVDLTEHARARYRERLDPRGTDAEIRAAVRRSWPATEDDARKLRKGRRGVPVALRVEDADGTVYGLRFACPDRVVLTTVMVPAGRIA